MAALTRVLGDMTDLERLGIYTYNTHTCTARFIKRHLFILDILLFCYFKVMKMVS